VIAALVAAAMQFAPLRAVVPARADTPAVPKAVFIVGPAGVQTDSDLVDAEKMAEQAEAAGMDVRRVFFPDATWDNVLANIQGANLVVYMGHGYGWPSPYTKTLTESRQDGMGLNSFAGSSKTEYTYYGADLLRANITLADSAVVILNHLCYSAGNGEEGTAIPAEDVARQRVDNMASGWLATGARAVFGFTWWQNLNFPEALMAAGATTVDDLFMGPANGTPAGFIGWHDTRFASGRIPGALNHLDPHSSYGYMRAVTGDLGMTTAEWRAALPPSDYPPVPPNPAGPPQITALSADGGGVGTSNADVPMFHPNGDGLDDLLTMEHTVTRAAFLDATVTDGTGAIVRSYTVWSAGGSGSSTWDGKANDGSRVPDGRYTLTYVPRDLAGEIGSPAAVQAEVLTAIALAKPSRTAINAADSDGVAQKVQLKVTVNQPAQVTWVLTDSTGHAVRSIRSSSSVAASALSFAWDGRSDSGAFVPDGWYDSLVTAHTNLGTYSEARQVFVGAFQVVPSDTTATRGTQIIFRIAATEPLAASPSVTISQPGLDPWTVQATHLKGRDYQLKVTLQAGGDPGTLQLQVAGTAKSGASQESSSSLPLH
jgi:flagellar hook assembly protein FlgD